MNTGDIVWVNFDPAFGHEQSGRRPALVLSNRTYNERSSFAVICPITRSRKAWPFHVPVPEGLRVTGFIAVDQIKAVDQRRIVRASDERVDAACLARVSEFLSLITFTEPLA